MTYRLEERLVVPRVVLGHSLLDHNNSDLSWVEST